MDGERKFTGILHDLTARVRIEEQLRERAAMARIGEMAAVIAHEVKNPLAGVRGAIQVIGGRLPDESRDASIVQDILTRIDALDALMKDLLLFARPPQPHRASVDVVSLVTMTADLICQDPSLRGVQIDVTGSSPPVSADAGMLKIVFQNLLVNSAHAIQGQGTIQVAVEARRQHVPDRVQRQRSGHTGRDPRQDLYRVLHDESRAARDLASRRRSGSSRRTRAKSRSSARRPAGRR